MPVCFLFFFPFLFSLGAPGIQILTSGKGEGGSNKEQRDVFHSDF